MEEHPAVFEEINETAKKYNTALSYAKQGSDDLAMIQVKKVLSITPNFVNAHLLFALLHMRAGDNVSAQTDLNNALAIDRYNTTARKYLNEMGEQEFKAYLAKERKKYEQMITRSIEQTDKHGEHLRSVISSFVEETR